MPSRQRTKNSRAKLGFNALESRITPAITIQFDYSYDSTGFFSENPSAVAVLDQAAQIISSQINNTPTAITPDTANGNSYALSFINPSSGSIVRLANKAVPADTLIIYAGGYNPSAANGGSGEPGASAATGTAAFVTNVTTRGETGAAVTWGGSVSFSTAVPWSFVGESGTPAYYQLDFLTDAVQELAQVLGVGTTKAWYTDIDKTNETFTGVHADAAYGGPVPLYTGGPVGDAGSRWAPGILSYAQEPLLDSTQIFAGARKLPTSLDWAGIADIGWSVDHLAFTTEPPLSSSANAGFGLVVAAEDPTGQVDTLFTGTIALAMGTNPGGGTLAGTLSMAATGGLATFSGLSINQPGVGYTLQASSSALPNATSNTFDVTAPGTVEQLAVSTEPPVQVVAGAPFSITFSVDLPSGAVDTSYNDLIALNVVNNPGNTTLHGPLLVFANNGVAVFSGLSLDAAAGGYTIAGVATGLSSSPAITNPIQVVASPLFHLVFTTQPPPSVQTFTNFSVGVIAEDPYGNLETNYNDILTLTMANNAGNAIFIGGKTLTADAAGVTFGGLQLSQAADGYLVRVTSTNGTTSLSNPFDVVAPAGSGNVGTPPAAPSPSSLGAPKIIRETPIFAGSGKHKHLIGFRLVFNQALDPATASNGGNYIVSQNVKQGRRTMALSLDFQAMYNGANDSVSLLLEGLATFKRGGKLVVVARLRTG